MATPTEMPAVERLKSQLLTSGLQQQNFVLYQVIDGLINALKQTINVTQTRIAEVTNTEGVIPITPERAIVLGSFVTHEGDNDSIEGMMGPMGPIGLTGKTGQSGPLGLDGFDGQEGMIGPIGPRGNTGSQGGSGSMGPPWYESPMIHHEWTVMNNNLQNMNLGTMAFQNSNAVSITGGSISGLTALGVNGIVTITRASGGTLLNLVSTGVGATNWQFYHTTAGNLSIWNGADRFMLNTNGDAMIQTAKRFYFDGGTDTFIVESAANTMQFFTGGTIAFFLTNVQDAGIGFQKTFWFDGGGDTGIHSALADKLHLKVGGQNSIIVGLAEVTFNNVDIFIQSDKKIHWGVGADTYIEENSANVMNLVTGGVAHTFDATGYKKAVWPTTASAASAVVVDGDYIRRSTSGKKYKKNIESITEEQAINILCNLRPITYASKTKGDDNNRRWPGLIAEEVAEIEPILAIYAQGLPDYVAYDRIPVYLIKAFQNQQREILQLKKTVRQLQNKGKEK